MARKDQTWESKIDVIRGKNAAKAATAVDVKNLLTFIDLLVKALDEADNEDMFGTEGWRRNILGEDS